MPPVMFINDIRRTDKQKGIFGELSLDMSETSELTIGARWYDIEVDLEGSANSAFSTGFIPAGASHNDRKDSEPIYQVNIMDLEVILVILHWMLMIILIKLRLMGSLAK